MKSDFIAKLIALKTRHKEIENIFSNKKHIYDKKKFSDLSKEYFRITEIKKNFTKWEKIKKEIKKLKNISYDPEINLLVQEELIIFNKKLKKIEKKLKNIFLPKNINDKRNCYIEIHAGTGGHEAALFAGDLFKMYVRYAEFSKWKVEIINTSYGEHGGYKEITLKVIGINAYKYLKFESGGHRVQRIPETESQGRIHTSTCTVAVLPELLESECPNINSSDLKIDTFRSSGAGGQHVNTTDSAIRITHLPTGIVVACQDERSQHKNKSKALAVLGARIRAIELANREIEKANKKRTLLGTGDRSDRNRTYNFPQSRITDHRIKLTIYKLEEVMSGKLNLIINEIIKKINEV